MSVIDRYQQIERSIQEILQKQGREKEDFTLIAVTKTVETDAIEPLIKTNCRDVGENRPQELNRKYDFFKSHFHCHMIGHLQTNKVKDVIGKVVLIQSLDRMSLLKEIEKRSKKDGNTTDCLIELNIGEEEQKSGIYLKDLDDFVQQVEQCEFVKVKGFMTVAPACDNPEDVRPVFRKMKSLFDEYKKKDFHNIEMKYLSMGMTHDYKVAVEEGSNMVRIGTAIFGERNYNI